MNTRSKFAAHAGRWAVAAAAIAIVHLFSCSEPVVEKNWNFDHQVIYVGLQRPDDVVSADVDGDGLLDLVIAEDLGITWFRNKGGNRPDFERFNPVCTDEEKTGFMGLWLSDFDGDQDLDICVSCKDDDRGYWFENRDGMGKEWLEHGLPFAEDVADHSRTHDFNNDGREDIVMQRYHGSGVFYMPSPADPSAEWPIFKIGEGRAGLSLHDMDVDGDMDVLINNRWLENPGDPESVPWPVRELPNTEDNVKNQAGDINNDGIPDIAHAQEEGESCYVLLSPSWKRITLKSDGNGLHTAVLEDFDLDGDLDLLTADIHGGCAYIFENRDGKGTAWLEHRLATWSEQGSHNLCTGDFNNDGLIDIAGKHYETGSALELWYNTHAVR